jgi:hypothetical protein
MDIERYDGQSLDNVHLNGDGPEPAADKAEGPPECGDGLEREYFLRVWTDHGTLRLPDAGAEPHPGWVKRFFNWVPHEEETKVFATQLCCLEGELDEDGAGEMKEVELGGKDELGTPRIIPPGAVAYWAAVHRRDLPDWRVGGPILHVERNWQAAADRELVAYAVASGMAHARRHGASSTYRWGFFRIPLLDEGVLVHVSPNAEHTFKWEAREKEDEVLAEIEQWLEKEGFRVSASKILHDYWNLVSVMVLEVDLSVVNVRAIGETLFKAVHAVTGLSRSEWAFA